MWGESRLGRETSCEPKSRAASSSLLCRLGKANLPSAGKKWTRDSDSGRPTTVAGSESLRDTAHLGNPFSPRDSAFSILLFWGKTDTEGRKLLSGKRSWGAGGLEGHPGWREGGGQGERRRHWSWARVWEEHALSSPLQAGRARSEYSSMIAVLPVTDHQPRAHFQIWGGLSIFHLDRGPGAALRPRLTHSH